MSAVHGTRGARAGGAWREAGVLALYAALLLAVTFPLLLHLGSRLLGQAEEIDFMGHVWHAWFFADSLLHGRNPYAGAMVLYPFGAAGFIVKSGLCLNAALTVPVQAVWNVVAGHNLSALLLALLGCYAGYRLALAVTGDRVGALAAGWLTVFNPYVLRELAAGRIDQASVGWLLLFMLFFLRVLRGGTWRDAMLAGVLLAVAAVSYMGYGMALIVWAGAAACLRWVDPAARPSRRDAARVAMAALVAAVLLAPLVAIYAAHGRAVLAAEGAAVGDHAAAAPRLPFLLRDFDELNLPARIILRGSLLPEALLDPGVHRPGQNLSIVLVLAAAVGIAGLAAERPLRKGEIAAVVAVAAAALLAVSREPALLPVAGLPGLALALRFRRFGARLWCFTFILSAVLALGPYLLADPDRSPAMFGLPMPAWFLYRAVPFYARVRVPDRLLVLVWTALAVAGGAGIGQLAGGSGRGAWRRGVAAALLLAAVTTEYGACLGVSPRLPVTRPVATPAIYTWLRDAEPGAVIGVPIHLRKPTIEEERAVAYPYWPMHEMYCQVTHRRPALAGLWASPTPPAAWRDYIAGNTLLSTLVALQSPARLPPSFERAVRLSDPARLARDGFRYVVVSDRWLPRASVDAVHTVLRELLGPPVRAAGDEGISIYRLAPDPPAEPPAGAPAGEAAGEAAGTADAGRAP